MKGNIAEYHTPTPEGWYCWISQSHTWRVILLNITPHPWKVILLNITLPPLKGDIAEYYTIKTKGLM